MSRLGKIPINIKDGVSVSIQGEEVTVTGPKGSLSYRFSKNIKAEINDNQIVISQKKGDAENQKAIYGLTRMIITNMIKGVDTGFEKKLELSGVGYRASLLGEDLVLSVGFSHPVVFKKTEGINFSIVEGEIIISGINKEIVGNIAAKIRAIRPPEPYKGKGIKYVGEKIRRKAGKAAKAVGGK